MLGRKAFEGEQVRARALDGQNVRAEGVKGRTG